MRIQFWPKTGSGALYLKLREILQVYWMNVSDPGWFSESRTCMVRQTPKVWKQKIRIEYYLKYKCNRLFKISLRLRNRAPDPVSDPHPWIRQGNTFPKNYWIPPSSLIWNLFSIGYFTRFLSYLVVREKYRNVKFSPSIDP